ncbi:MAG: hypothetical protein R3214_13375 [Christiangramia sp.]|nr:hypothetical protein [Christiangramia sp.]
MNNLNLFLSKIKYGRKGEGFGTLAYVHLLKILIQIICPVPGHFM